jgi:hypothetical protein
VLYDADDGEPFSVLGLLIERETERLLNVISVRRQFVFVRVFG